MRDPKLGLPDGGDDSGTAPPDHGQDGAAPPLDDQSWRTPAVEDALRHLGWGPAPDADTFERVWQRIDGALIAGEAGGAVKGRPGAVQRAPASAPSVDAGRGAWWVAAGATLLSTAVIVALLLSDDSPAPRHAVAVRPGVPTPSAAAPITAEAPTAEPERAPEAQTPPDATEPQSPPPVAETLVERPPTTAAPAPAEPRAELPRPSPDDALRSEVRLVERARDALAHNAPAEALRALSHHRRRFPAGQLVEERAALEIIAHAHMRNAAVALPLSARFLDRYGSSVHAQAVRDAVDSLR